MPELPEVEAVCRRLQKEVAGRTILRASINRPQVTKPQSPRSFARKLAKRKIQRVERRAKNVLLHLDHGEALKVHLRMTGDLLVTEEKDRSVSVRARLLLDDGRELIFRDSRLLGHMQLLDAAGLARLEGALGIEPLTAGFTPAFLWNALSRSRVPVKLFLMDQTRIAGLGNIWAAEALFQARIDPRRPANTLSKPEAARLRNRIVKTLEGAVESAYRDYTGPGRAREEEGFRAAVYRRSGLPCVRCRGKVQKIRQGGRTTYFCPHCQG